jgi:hypothetical protein
MCVPTISEYRSSKAVDKSLYGLTTAATVAPSCDELLARVPLPLLDFDPTPEATVADDKIVPVPLVLDLTAAAAAAAVDFRIISRSAASAPAELQICSPMLPVGPALLNPVPLILLSRNGPRKFIKSHKYAASPKSENHSLRRNESCKWYYIYQFVEGYEKNVGKGIEQTRRRNGAWTGICWYGLLMKTHGKCATRIIQLPYLAACQTNSSSVLKCDLTSNTASFLFAAVYASNNRHSLNSGNIIRKMETNGSICVCVCICVFSFSSVVLGSALIFIST